MPTPLSETATNASPLRHGVQRVQDDVGDDLPQLAGVPQDGARPLEARDHLDVDPPALRFALPARTRELNGVLDDLVEVALHRLAGRPAAGHAEQAANDGPPLLRPPHYYL